MKIRWKLLAVVGVVSWACAFAEPSVVPVPIPLGLPPLPAGRAEMLTQGKIDLGKKMFYDQRFSFSGKTSCASCHIPEHGFSDFTARGFTSFGAPLQRNTPTVLNAVYQTSQFWDGRAASLEEQASDVYHAKADNNIEIGDALAKVKADPAYVADFQRVFGAEPTAEAFCQAIACYESTMLSGGTRFDRYLFGGDNQALTSVEKQGYKLFAGKAACTQCHTIGSDHALLMDGKFHNLGVGFINGRQMQDGGRYLETDDRKDFGVFKTPQLRNLTLTTPYMHDGSLATLEQVVAFYNRGGIRNPNLDPAIKPLRLNKVEQTALVAFLKTLTDPKYARNQMTVPQLKARLQRELEGR